MAAGDVNNDGVPDFITGPESGTASQVRVFDGTNVGNTLVDTTAYASFNGGFRSADGVIADPALEPSRPWASEVGVRASARFGRSIYVRPGLGIAIHNGSAKNFEDPTNGKIDFGSRR